MGKIAINGDFQLLLLLLLLLLSLYMYIYDHRIILIHPCDISLSRLVLHGLRLRQQLVQASFVQGRGTAGPPQGPVETVESTGLAEAPSRGEKHRGFAAKNGVFIAVFMVNIQKAIEHGHL